MPPGFLEQDVEGASAAARVEGDMLAVDGLLQARETFGFHLFVHLLRHLGRGRARTRRVFERERASVRDLVNEGERRLEIGFGLARKADDEIGAERECGLRVTQALE